MKQKMVQVGPQCRTAADEAKMADPPSSSAHQSTRRQHSLKCETHTPETERSALRRLQQKSKKKEKIGPSVRPGQMCAAGSMDSASWLHIRPSSCSSAAIFALAHFGPFCHSSRRRILLRKPRLLLSWRPLNGQSTGFTARPWSVRPRSPWPVAVARSCCRPLTFTAAVNACCLSTWSHGNNSKTATILPPIRPDETRIFGAAA